MDTIIMISKCGKKLDPHRLILTLTDTLKLKQEWYVSLSKKSYELLYKGKYKKVIQKI